MRQERIRAFATLCAVKGGGAMWGFATLRAKEGILRAKEGIRCSPSFNGNLGGGRERVLYGSELL